MNAIVTRTARVVLLALFCAMMSVAMAREVAPLPAKAVPRAFPGAEGYGSVAVGGRGGKVLAVTNLNGSGPGSLREAVEARGPRIVVFRVSGTVEGSFKIKNDFITIAGQTASGDGICIKGSLAIDASDVIIRYIRVRPDPSAGEVDAITGRGKRNIILDHVSASWSSDEVLSLYRNENVTIQWCLISEACIKMVDGKDTGHRFGGIWGNSRGTYHHNLFAHNDSRNPRWASGSKFNDYRNNVIYNWGYNSCYGGGAVADSDPSLNFSTFNMVANYYKPGPATRDNVRRRIAAPVDAGGVGSWYVADNVVEGFPEVTADNWKGIDGGQYKRLEKPWDAMPIRQETAEEALRSVLERAGCSRPYRDAVDRRVIGDVRAGTASCGSKGMIATPADVGGWPVLRSEAAPADSDQDGMPDRWETDHGLDPGDPSDGAKDRDGDGYTNVEEFLNATPAERRTIRWDRSDDFNGNAVDWRKWNKAPENFGAWIWDNEANVSVSNGVLIITARYVSPADKLPQAPTNGPGSSALFTSGMLKSYAADTYAYYEARIKGAPVFPGVCPAFWLYSRIDDSLTEKGTVRYSEVDIVELTQRGGNATGNERIMDHNLHAILSNGRKGVAGRQWQRPEQFKASQANEYNAPFDPREDFHTYGCKVGRNDIVWYVDGIEVGRKRNLYWHRKMNVALSLGLRAPYAKFENNRLVPTESHPTDKLPTSMMVDYVRVWELDE